MASISGLKGNWVIASGRVAEDATVISGNNFVPVKIGTGLYTVVFTPPFASRPTVIASQVYAGKNETGGNTKDNALVVAVTAERAVIKTGTPNGNASDRQFTFIAVGQLGDQHKPANPISLAAVAVLMGGNTGYGIDAKNEFVAVGINELKLSPSFENPPVAVAIQSWEEGNFLKTGGSTTDNAVIIGSWSDRIRVAVGDGGGTKTNRAYHLLLAGSLNAQSGSVINAVSEIVHGSVKSDGTVKSGSKSFTVVKSGMGLWHIVFHTPFAQRPVVVANVTSAGDTDNVQNEGGSTLDNACILAINNQQVLIKTGNSHGNAHDMPFEFIALA